VGELINQCYVVDEALIVNYYAYQKHLIRTANESRQEECSNKRKLEHGRKYE